MSQLFLKRCDHCGGISEMANTPIPDGWTCLADVGMGTLASFDICAECQENMGIRKMIQSRLQARAVGQLKTLIRPAELPELAKSLHFDEIIAKIEAGEFDEAFAQGDGIDLPVTVQELEDEATITEGELV